MRVGSPLAARRSDAVELALDEADEPGGEQRGGSGGARILLEEGEVLEDFPIEFAVAAAGGK